jgi:predicted nuclease of predicted toxin-antitoxin system
VKILFDQGVPAPLAAHLAGHGVVRAAQRGWSGIRNGDLLARAEGEFDALVTTDQNLAYQQNLKGRRIAILVLGRGNWPQLQPHAARIAAAVNRLAPGEFVEVAIPAD